MHTLIPDVHGNATNGSPGVEENVEKLKTLLEESEARYRSLTDALPQLMWMSLPDGNVTYANKRCLEYSGLANEQKYGEGWVRTIHPEDLPRVGELWGKSMATGETFQAEYRIRRADGVYRWFLGRAVPIHENGKIIHWIGTATDIEEQKVALNKLELETKLREQFVATLTHDLRNPLTSVKLNAHLLTKLSHDPKLSKLSGRVIEGAERVDQMIENLLDVSKIKAGESIQLQKENVEIVGLTRETMTELEAIHGNRFTFSTTHEKIEGLWNTDALRRVMENLFVNAIKYGSEDTLINISLKLVGPKMTLDVQNAGEPIPSHEISELFTPFRQSTRQTKFKKGWGLGLTLVKGFTEAMGGRVSVVSGEKSGTIFTVELNCK